MYQYFFFVEGIWFYMIPVNVSGRVCHSVTNNECDVAYFAHGLVEFLYNVLCICVYVLSVSCIHVFLVAIYFFISLFEPFFG